MIYLIKLKNTPYVKIGYTTNVASRYSIYKTMVPPDLIEFFWYKNGERPDEKAYHKRFARYKKTNSEWMNIPKDILNILKTEFIDANSIKPTLDKVEWYNQNILKLVELCRKGLSPNKAAYLLGVKNWDWIKYANNRHKEETGKSLSEEWKKKDLKEPLSVRIGKEINNLYNDGKTVSEISKIVNRSENIVLKYLTKISEK